MQKGAFMRIPDDKILTALASCPTIRQAAEQLNVSESMIYKRLQDVSFKQRYAVYCRNLADETIKTLQYYNTQAVQVIADIMTDETAAAATRLNAATYILNMTNKYISATNTERELEEQRAEREYNRNLFRAAKIML